MKLIDLNPRSTVYISGGITGIPNYEEVFQRAEDVILATQRMRVVNPCKVEPHPRSTHPYGKYMRAVVKAMMDCDAVYMLRGWEQSQGARAEHTLAALCGMPIAYEVAA